MILLISEHDLRQAIAECQGERNPNANTCVKLAAFYTIRDHLYGTPSASEASFAAAPEIQPSEAITYRSDTEFSQSVRGKDPDSVLAVVDDLMNTLQAVCPRLYRITMRHFREL